MPAEREKDRAPIIEANQEMGRVLQVNLEFDKARRAFVAAAKTWPQLTGVKITTGDLDKVLPTILQKCPATVWNWIQTQDWEDKGDVKGDYPGGPDEESMTLEQAVQMISGLQSALDVEKAAKAKLESEVTTLRNAVGTKNNDIKNKDAVIADLQKELEEMRATGGDGGAKVEDLRGQVRVLTSEVERLSTSNREMAEKLSFFEGKAVVGKVPNPYGPEVTRVLQQLEKSAKTRLTEEFAGLDYLLQGQFKNVIGVRFTLKAQDLVNICVLAGMLRIQNNEEVNALLTRWKGDYTAYGYDQVLRCLFEYLLGQKPEEQ